MKSNGQAIKTAYEAPLIEVIEVEVEQGFAGSTAGISGGMGESDDMGGSGNVTVP